MKRFIKYFEGLASRTLFGTDGSEPMRSGVISYVLEGLEGLVGFVGFIVLPGIAGACVCRWLFG